MKRSQEFGKFARRFNSRVAYFVPHSFLFAILLTFLAYFLGILVTYQGPFDMVRFWVSGVWNLLSFSMQMVLLVAAGFSVASAPPSQRLLRFLAGIPSTPRGGVMFLTAFAALCSLLHWGLGIIAGAFLAREMGRKIPHVDYPLLVASAFIGMCAGNLGIFSSDPLVIRKAAPFLEKAMGVAPNSEATWTLAAVAGFLMGVGGVMGVLGLICPEDGEATAGAVRAGRAGRGSFHCRRAGDPPERGAVFRSMAGTQPLARMVALHHGVFLRCLLVLWKRFRLEPERPDPGPLYAGPLLP
jgi:short subunit fatty acids transporter